VCGSRVFHFTIFLLFVEIPLICTGEGKYFSVLVYITKERVSVQSYILTNEKGLRSDEEKLVKDTDWKQIPECGYVVKSKDRKLHCTYKYDSERLVLSKAISAYAVDENHEDIVKECSVKFCPFKLYLGV
jgi:hypothetical protein